MTFAEGADVFPVCLAQIGVPKVALLTEAAYLNHPDPGAFALERDEFGRLFCPGCGECYGREWPGV